MIQEWNTVLTKLDDLDQRIGKLEQNDKKLDHLVNKMDSILKRIVVITILSAITAFAATGAMFIYWTL